MKLPLACVLFLALLVPCAGASPSAEQPAATPTAGAWRVTDCLGRTLLLREVPQRIVLAGRATLLIVDAVYMFPDARGRVVGVGQTNQGLGDVFPVLDPRSAEKARFDNSAGPEQLAGLSPDLVILKSYMKDKVGDRLESIGIPVLYVDLESPAAFAADIRMLGDLFRDPARAAFINRYYEARVATVRKKVAGARRPTALVVQYSERDGAAAFSIPPAAWIQALMVETAGGEPVWKSAGAGNAPAAPAANAPAAPATNAPAAPGWNKVSAEQAAAWQPQHVLVVSYQKPSTDAVAVLRKSGTWNARISPFPADYLSWDQSDARWILGLQWVARTLHPDLFAGLDLREEVFSFYCELYGMDRQAVETAVLPRLERVLASE